MPNQDTFPHFRYRLKVEDRPVAGFTRINGILSGTTSGRFPVEADLPADNGYADEIAYGRVSMKWGLIYDPDFEEWATSLAEGDSSLCDIRVEVLDETGKTVGTFGLDACRATGIASVPKPASDMDMVAVETLVLACEKWYRI